MDNLILAHKNASKGKGWYQEVQEINKDPERHLKEIQDMLLNKTFRTSAYEIFERKEGKKIRKIYKLPYFPDRIVQWAILQVIEPYLIRHMISDTYSAIPNRGIHKGLAKLKRVMHNDVRGCKYCLKLDARHYYQTINHNLLIRKFRRLFKDEDLIWILSEIIQSVATIDPADLILLETDADPETGIPIGNYLSQYCGNFYFSSFDHCIKEVCGVKYYFRYMDDIVIFAETKAILRSLIKSIKHYFEEELKLLVKDNWQIFPSNVRGVDFLGYRVFNNFILLRKTTCQDMKKKFREILKHCETDNNLMNYSYYCSINSYMGWVKHCDAYRLIQKYYKPLQKHSERYYNDVIEVNKKSKKKKQAAKKGEKQDGQLWNNQEYRQAA